MNDDSVLLWAKMPVPTICAKLCICGDIFALNCCVDYRDVMAVKSIVNLNECIGSGVAKSDL